MLSKFFKNLSINKKILFVFSTIVILTQVTMFILSFYSMKNIENYTNEQLQYLSSKTSEDGGNILKNQAENQLKTSSYLASESIKSILENVSNQVENACSACEKFYKSKNNFKGKIFPLPEATLSDIRENASSKAYAIDSSSNKDDPLVYYTSEYSNNNIIKYDNNTWNSLNNSDKDTLSKENFVVSKNTMPIEIYNQMLNLNNFEYIFESIYKSDDCISSIYIGTENGIFYKYSADNSYKRYDPRTRPWYKDAVKQLSKDNKPVWQNTYISKSNGKFCITCSKTFKDSNNKILGVCAIDMYIDDISKIITNSKIGNSGYNFVVDENSNIIMHPDFLKFNNLITNSDNNNDEKKLINKVIEKKSGIFNFNQNEKSYYVACDDMGINNWIWVSVVEENEIMSPISEVKNIINEHSLKSENELKKDFAVVFLRFIIILFIIFIVAYFMCIKFSKTISKPIIKLSHATKDIGKGNFSLNISSDSKDEIGELANSFNLMSKNLKKYMEDLSKTISEKEKIHSELMVAKKIQRSMLPYIFPAFPERKDFDIYAIMDPAKEVGGDFYDFFFIDKKHLALVIADVSGKGVSAALFMVIAKILIKNELQNGCKPEEVFKIVNNRLCENNEAGMFVTCFLGVLNIENGEFVYANAGHNPPILYKNSEKSLVFFRNPHSFVLGGMKNLKYTQDKIYISSDDLLFMYTDGVIEAMNIEGKLFTEKKLENILKYCIENNMNIQNIIKFVRKEIDEFAGNAERADDITMLAFKDFTISPN